MNNYFPDNLRILRKHSNMTQDMLGKMLGISLSTVSGYESGYRSPNNEMLRKLANIFRVSPTMLLESDLSQVDDLDIELKAEVIKGELVRMQITDGEFDQLMTYIKFLQSARK